MTQNQKEQVYKDIKEQRFNNEQVSKLMQKSPDFIYSICNVRKKINIYDLMKVYETIGIPEGWKKILEIK